MGAHFTWESVNLDQVKQGPFVNQGKDTSPSPNLSPNLIDFGWVISGSAQVPSIYWMMRLEPDNKVKKAKRRERNGEYAKHSLS